MIESVSKINLICSKKNKKKKKNYIYKYMCNILVRDAIS